MMKNIQVIDGALNTEYLIYSVTEEEYNFIFPAKDQDIEFIEDLIDRSGDEKSGEVLRQVWLRPVEKPNVTGIHGTLFYGLYWKKNVYPTKRECDMVFVFPPIVLK